MQRKKTRYTSAVNIIENCSKQAIKNKKAVLRKMRAEAKCINKKGTNLLPFFAQIHSADSDCRAPRLKMYAVTNHPGSYGIMQDFRPFETVEDLTNPDNLFIAVDKIIEVAEEHFLEVILLNETATIVYAAHRRLQKALNE